MPGIWTAHLLVMPDAICLMVGVRCSSGSASFRASLPLLLTSPTCLTSCHSTVAVHFLCRFPVHHYSWRCYSSLLRLQGWKFDTLNALAIASPPESVSSVENGLSSTLIFCKFQLVSYAIFSGFPVQPPTAALIAGFGLCTLQQHYHQPPLIFAFLLSAVETLPFLPKAMSGQLHDIVFWPTAMIGAKPFVSIERTGTVVARAILPLLLDSKQISQLCQPLRLQPGVAARWLMSAWAGHVSCIPITAWQVCLPI